MKPRAFLFVAVATVAAAVAACSSEPQPPTNSVPVIAPGKPGEEASTIPPGEAGPVEQPEPNEADVSFVRDMIIHHQQALDMAALAPDRASSAKVKSLADRIADTQGAEIAAMNQWLRQHEQPTVDPTAPEHEKEHADMPGMATRVQLGELRAANGTVFDVVFLQLMITHHEGALTMANEVQNAGIDIRVQQIADDVIAEQTDQIGIMREMLGS